MKNLIYLFLGLGLVSVWACADNDNPTTTSDINLCEDDYAEYYHNDILFRTMHLPDGGEFVNPSGVSCGIVAVLQESLNILSLRIIGEGQDFYMRADISTLNENTPFSYIRYIDDTDVTFENSSSDQNNYILIEELDTLNKTIKGVFDFEIEISGGDMMNITNGNFNCSYSSF